MTVLNAQNTQFICDYFKAQQPNLLGIYAFGSQVQGTANKDSDLDLAILIGGYADTLKLWDCANDLANKLHIEVDLLDLRAASTVMQYQVITQGKRLWHKDVGTDLFETYVLSEKTNLDESRAALLSEIRESGTVYGK